MRRARVLVGGVPAGELQEISRGKLYVFRYLEGYTGSPVSLTMPVEAGEIYFESFPPYFDGVLPEGDMLEGLLRVAKIDRDDLFSQLLAVGRDLVGAVTIEEMP